MKKLFRILIVLLIALSFISCGKEVTSQEAKEALSKHLVERYGEEFEIGYIGRRSDGKEVWYEAEIYPSKYVGTPKERDKYYRESGTVNIEKGIFGEKLGKAGDTYGIVKVNESAEEFYGKKLEELFGNNVLQVYDIWFNRILEDYSFENIIRVSDEERTALIIKGGIYIFGRVENDEDREWYRTQIYEFIQFMKETGTFEYVDLGVIVWDERVLSDEFRENKKLRNEIIAARNTYKDNKEFIKIRKKLMSKTNKSAENLTNKEKKEILDNYNRSQMYGENNNVDKILAYNELLGIKIYSPKYIESQGLYHRKKSNYEKIEDIEYWNEIY